MRKVLLAVFVVTVLAVGLLAQNGGFNQSGGVSTWQAVVALFSGCSGTKYLGADGACHTAGGGGGGGVEHYLLFPATGSCALANYAETGTSLYCLQNQSTGAFDYSGSDVAAIVNSALAAMTHGGEIDARNGVYNINSLTQDTTCTTTYYGIGFPVISATQPVTYVIRGESSTFQQGELGNAVTQINGVIFNVTTTARASVATTNKTAALFQQGCSTFGNDVYLYNITARFPSQQVNEYGFDMLNTTDVDYEQATADFATQYPSLITPAAGSFGITTSGAGRGNIQRVNNTWSVGYETAYDFEEHTISDSASAIYSTYAGILGATPSTYPIVIRKFSDQENIYGLQLGGNLQPHSMVDITEMVMEILNTGTFARAGYMTESNPGYSSGIISYLLSGPAFGGRVQFVNSIFPAGEGLNIKQIPGNEGFPNYGNFAVDNADRPDNAGPGQPWQAVTGFAHILAIASNVFTNGNGTSANAYNGITVGTNQFSRATIAALDASDTDVQLATNVQSGAQTYYVYACPPSGSALSKRTIYKVVAGSGTVLVATVSTSDCAAGDKFMLVANGGANGVTLTGYYNGAVDITATDSSTPITGGIPGMTIIGSSGASGLTAWCGGNGDGGQCPN